MKFVDVEILNWEKYNPRGDVKRPSWFRFENRLVESSEFFDIPGEQFKALIYLLSQASQKNSGVVTIDLSHALRVSCIKDRDFLGLLKKLQAIQMVLVSDTRTSRERNEDVSLRTDETDETRRNTTDTPTRARGIAEFEEKVYGIYPRKEGKKRGLEICRAKIKSDEELESLVAAVRRYTAHHKASGKSAEFLMHFSTFMGCWTDWTDPNAGKVVFTPRVNPNPPPARTEPLAEEIPIDPNAAEKMREVLKGLGGAFAFKSEKFPEGDLV